MLPVSKPSAVSVDAQCRQGGRVSVQPIVNHDLRERAIESHRYALQKCRAFFVSHWPKSFIHSLGGIVRPFTRRLH
jgi:hypothetical protein